MMNQVSKVTTKNYQMEFEWTMENLWAFQWTNEEFLESKVLNFKEAKVST